MTGKRVKAAVNCQAKLFSLQLFLINLIKLAPAPLQSYNYLMGRGSRTSAKKASSLLFGPRPVGPGVSSTVKDQRGSWRQFYKEASSLLITAAGKNTQFSDKLVQDQLDAPLVKKTNGKVDSKVVDLNTNAGTNIRLVVLREGVLRGVGIYNFQVTSSSTDVCESVKVSQDIQDNTVLDAALVEQAFLQSREKMKFDFIETNMDVDVAKAGIKSGAKIEIIGSGWGEVPTLKSSIQGAIECVMRYGTENGLEDGEEFDNLLAQLEECEETQSPLKILLASPLGEEIFDNSSPIVRQTFA